MNNIKRVILALSLAWCITSASANNLELEEQDLVEFCVATLIVAQDADEYDIWKGLYAPDMEKVIFFQNLLFGQLKANNITKAEVVAAAIQCKQSRKEDQS